LPGWFLISFPFIAVLLGALVYQIGDRYCPKVMMLIAHRPNKIHWNLGQVSFKKDLLAATLGLLFIGGIYTAFPTYSSSHVIDSLPEDAKLIPIQIQNDKSAKFERQGSISRKNPYLTFVVRSNVSQSIQVYYADKRNGRIEGNHRYFMQYKNEGKLEKFTVQIPQLTGRSTKIRIGFTSKEPCESLEVYQIPGDIDLDD
jgi:hypothetical protein